MKLNNIINSIIKEYLLEQEASNNPSEYTGQHSAPQRDVDNDPMHNVVNMFPDMYTDNALRYYGGYGLDDRSVIYQIQSVHNKPNASVKIYRAVPNLNKDVDKQIKELNDIIRYKNKYRFYPMKNDIVNKLEDEIWHDGSTLSYDEKNEQIRIELYKMIDELTKQRKNPIKINNGDWVTTSRQYAIQHGQSNLNNNYKIVTKTVKAKQLYTDGNSIFEWGYNV